MNYVNELSEWMLCKEALILHEIHFRITYSRSIGVYIETYSIMIFTCFPDIVVTIIAIILIAYFLNGDNELHNCHFLSCIPLT